MNQPSEVIITQPGDGGVPLYVSPQGVTVRTMTQQDADFAGQQLVDGFKDKFVHNIGTRNLPLARDAVADAYQQSPHVYQHALIAEYDGRKAGVVQLKLHGDRDPNDSQLVHRMGCCCMCRMAIMKCLSGEISRGMCYVDSICVAEGFRGKGIGTALLTASEQLARKQNCSTICLYVASNNRAKSLYDRHGYQKTDSFSMCCLAYCLTGVWKFEKMDKSLTSASGMAIG